MHTARFSACWLYPVVSGGGVSAQGVCLLGGLYPSMQWGTHPPPCEQNDWQIGVNTLPCPKLSLRAVIMQLNWFGDTHLQLYFNILKEVIRLAITDVRLQLPVNVPN